MQHTGRAVISIIRFALRNVSMGVCVKITYVAEMKVHTGGGCEIASKAKKHSHPRKTEPAAKLNINGHKMNGRIDLPLDGQELKVATSRLCHTNVGDYVG